MTSTDKKRYLQGLIESLQLVASDYPTQVGRLPPLVHIPDEIAIMYTDASILVEQILAAGLIDHLVAAKVKALDDHFARMTKSRNREIWTLDGLKERSEWALARRLAREILSAMGVSPNPDSTLQK